MRTIFAEYNPKRNSIDVYTSVGYMNWKLLLNYSFLYIIWYFPELMPIICFLISNHQCFSIY